MRAILTVLIAAATLPAMATPAAQLVGMNTPAPPLTAARIRAELPKAQQAAWLAYLRKSAAQMRADRAALAAELEPGETPPPPPRAVGLNARNMPTDRDPAWYASAEAIAIARNIISFQTPAGGWSKNQNRAGPPRLRGQRFANNAETMDPDRRNFDAPNDRFWTFVGTFDNDATTTEMKFLARVIAALPEAEGAPYRASFVRGVRYMLAAQYPNGGWPQIYPLEGGFHDGITFNDNAVALVVTLLDEVAKGQYPFVPADLRVQAAGAVRRAIEVILAAQIRRHGKLLGWPQQVDAITLQPISARNYEPRSIASGETADLLLFLMRRPNPSPAIRRSVEGGVAWLRQSAAYDVHWGENPPHGRQLVARKGAGPIWARNYSLTTGKPIFGDRDQTIRGDVNHLSSERRNSYGWWVPTPARAIAAYSDWARAQRR